jgi:AraC family transcriptional regulator
MGPDAGMKEQWALFMSDFGKIAGQVGLKAYGVCHSFDRAANQMDYMTAVEVTDAGEVPGYLFTLIIPARKVAVFVHRGNISGISNTWDQIYSTWLPAAGLAVANGPQFEVYDEDSGADDDISQVEIHIPVT